MKKRFFFILAAVCLAFAFAFHMFASHSARRAWSGLIDLPAETDPNEMFHAATVMSHISNCACLLFLALIAVSSFRKETPQYPLLLLFLCGLVVMWFSGFF